MNRYIVAVADNGIEICRERYGARHIVSCAHSHKRRVADYLHTQRFAGVTYEHADGAETDDTDFLAADFMTCKLTLALLNGPWRYPFRRRRPLLPAYVPSAYRRKDFLPQRA